MFQIAFNFEVIITLVYFLIIHDISMERYKHLGEFHLFVTTYLHVVPMITLILMIIIEKYRFSKQTVKSLSVIGTIYLAWNYVGVVIYKEPIYEFLKWNEVKTPIVIVIVGLVHLIVHYAMCVVLPFK